LRPLIAGRFRLRSAPRRDRRRRQRQRARVRYASRTSCPKDARRAHGG